VYDGVAVSVALWLKQIFALLTDNVGGGVTKTVPVSVVLPQPVT
jgi:hypothetical protein